MKKLSIVIVTYNSTKLISDCLDSIFNNNDIGDSLEVIVVDNASPEKEKTFSLIRSRFLERVIMLDSGVNGGYGKGNNFGIMHTSGEYVIVMNPDVRIISPIFKKILGKFEDPQIGMMGVKFVDGSMPYYFKPEYVTFLNSLFVHCYARLQKYDSQKMFMSGSFLVFRKDAFLKAGSFDENIFMYFEEADITNRIRKANYSVIWCPNILVEHLAHGRSFNPYLWEVGRKSFEYYCNKYGIDRNGVLKSYKRTLLVERIKLLGAFFLRNQSRIEMAHRTISEYKRRIKLLNK